MATTIKGYAEESLTRYQELKTSAQTEFTQLSSDLADAQVIYSERVAEYSDLGKEISATRKAMGDESLMPSDVEALATELRDLLIEQRAKRTEVLEAEETKRWLERQKSNKESQLGRLSKRVNLAETELDEAESRHEQHTAWKQSVSDGDVAALQAVATSVLDARSAVSEPADENEALIWAAKQRVEGDIPAVLLTRARERGALVDSRLAGRGDHLEWLEDKAGTQSAADDGAVGLSAQRWIAFERAEESFAVIVLQSQNRFNQAMTLLASVTASAELSVAETARITDVSLAADADAVVNEKARDDVVEAIYAKQLEVAQAIADALVADINADPELDSGVTDRKDELTTLVDTDLAAAEAAYDTSMRTAMDTWEGSVPDHIWANLTAYDRAVAILTAIKDADVATLSAAMDSTQTSLTEALELEDQAARLEEALEDAGYLAVDLLDILQSAYPAQVFSRVRGDN